MDLITELQQMREELYQSIKMLRANGIKLAEAERQYKVKLREEALKLRQEKGMAVTLIDLIIYGVPEVADLRLKRDIADAMYTANQEHINTTKLQIRILENQIAREWSSAGNGGL